VSSVHAEPYKVLLNCIRAARRAADVTQAELGKRLGMDQSFVSKYERGERRLDVVELRAICKALEIDLHEFLAQFEAKLKQKGLA
jgi:transcriptional regulator with XRE-family HTH domain